MHKRILLILSCTTSVLFFIYFTSQMPLKQFKSKGPLERQVLQAHKKGKKKTTDERRQFHEARLSHEFYYQANPITGVISKEDKRLELVQAERAVARNQRNAYTNLSKRGPGNLGGRTRSLVVDITDPSGNTLLAGAVSGGVFRTTDGGLSWRKVSPNDEIHNVTTIVQDPRPGFQNNWYYGTGEASGNSASLAGSFYLGRGVFQSNNGGLTWSQVAGTNSVQEAFDSRFDIVNSLAVHPTTGQLFAAISGSIVRFNGTAWVGEINNSSGGTNRLTDIVFTSSGRAFAAFSGNSDAAIQGVWTSATGTGAWSRIASNGNPAAWNSVGRCVLAIAPSAPNLLYALYVDQAGGTEADLWRWNQNTNAWTNFSGKLPDELGGAAGNDPFAVQGGYDLVVSVQPNNANFVVIGGTNVYRIDNINTSAQFERIGGYDNANGYALWPNGGAGDTHHPDVHALVFDPFNPQTLYSGTDGGVHRTSNISTTNPAVTAWTNLNNDYQSYQYYYVYLDQQTGSNRVLGGAQDNGTTAGGTDFGFGNNTDHSSVFSGDGAACAISRDDACLPFFMTTQNGNMVRDCPTFQTITPNGSASEFVTYFYMDPDNNSTIYYAGRNSIYRTNNSTNVTANTWTNMGSTADIGDTDFFKTFATTRGTYNPTNSYLLAGGDEGHIYRLDDPQNSNFTNAVDITPAGASTTFPSIVAGLSVHPTNPDIAMAVYSNYGIPSIYITNNATATNPNWTLVERNLSALSVRSCVIAEVSGQTLYFVGTARGLYSSLEPLTTDWSREGVNTVGFALVRSMAYRPSDNTLLLGTHGNGMFDAVINVPLSLDKLELNAQFSQGIVQLDWTAENEYGNDYFEIERSLDAINFEIIGRVLSQGDFAGVQQYNSKDKEVLATTQYYRIRLQESNGNQLLSKVVAVGTDFEKQINFSIFPNPVYEKLNIKIKGINTQKALQVRIVDAKGTVAYHQEISITAGTIELDLAKVNLLGGVYHLQLLQANNLIRSQRFIKQ